MFESASRIVITGGSFVAAQTNTGSIDDKADLNPILVYKNVSWNAILNSGGRADTVRCYPGTREAVMAQIETWISTADHTGQPIFWLSGPAGAGKSAIAQSIAERCLVREIPMANFFFFRADTTRNHAAPLVATLLCQLFEICPVIKWRIHDYVTQNPYIFDTSVEQQLKTLMLSTLLDPGQASTVRRKTVLILDGLDECSSDKNSTQQDILRALHHIVTHKDSPFILLVSSRAEPHLTRSFNAIHSHVARLYLDGHNFAPSDDIRRFVAGEFKEIKETHHLAWTLDSDWPSASDLESIVRKSSGQFIYAATVMRFLQTSPESPILSLEKVEGIRPVENDSPFAQLDAIYTHILAKARNWPKAREIMAAQVLPDIQDANLPTSFWMGTTPLAKTSYILDALGYNLNEVSSYTADLTALVKVDLGAVNFYHTSLGDFLLDRRRSGDFFIDLDKFRLKLVPALFYCVGGRMDNLSWSLVVEHFTRLKTTSDAMTQALSSSPLLLSGLAFNGTTLCAFLVKIQELYFEIDVDLYISILNKWLIWFHANHGTLEEGQLDGIQCACELWNQLTRTLALRSEDTQEEDNIKDQEVPLTDDSSSPSMAESAISEMLMLMQHLKLESLVDALPEEGIPAFTEQFDGGIALGIPLNDASKRSSIPAELDSNELPTRRASQIGARYSEMEPRHQQQNSFVEKARLLEELEGREAVAKRKQEEEKRVELDAKRKDEYDNVQPCNGVDAALSPLLNVLDIIPQSEAASPMVLSEFDAFSESQELQDLFTGSIGDALVQELLSIRAEAEATVAEISGVRAAVLTARMDLEAASNEARSVRADTKREVDIARNDVADAQAEVRRAYAERDAVCAEMEAARDEVKILREKILSAQAELENIHRDKKDTTSWWSLPELNYF